MQRALSAPRPWLQATILVLLAVGSYWSSRDNGFFFDDVTRVVENPGIRRLTPLSRFLTNPRLSASEKRIANYRPLLSLSLALDYHRAELDPGPYRDTQLLTHAAATLSTWGALGALLGGTAPGAAFWAAALVATHPVSGVAVRYISARDLLQMQFFLMASLGIYLWRRRRGGLTPGSWAAVLTLYSLSLLAKKNGVVLPLLIVWVEGVLPDASGEAPGWRVGLRRAVPFLVPLVLVGGLARFFLGHDELPMVLHAQEPVSLGYLATQAWAHWSHYLGGFLTPWTLRLEPAVSRLTWSDPRAWLGLGAITATLALAWRSRHRHPEAATCLVAYWLLLIPTSSILNLFAPVVPYRPYPSSAFLFGGITLALAARSRGTWVAGVLVVASLASALTTDAAWQDAESVWRTSLAQGGSSKALTSAALGAKDPAERARLLEANLRNRGSDAITGLALAEAWIRLGRREEGLALAREVRSKAAGVARFQEVAGRLFLAEGALGDALKAARAAHALDPGSITVRLLLAQALQSSGEVEASAPHLEFVAEFSPGFQDVDLRRGYVAEVRDDLPRAEALYRQYRARHPENAIGARYLGELLFRQGRFVEAVAELEAARRGGQGSRTLDQKLWASYRQLGKSSSAEEALVRLRRSPGR